MRIRDMSIIGEHPVRSVRMAYLATVAGAKVNGVAELHSQLLRDKVLPDFNEFFPGKFTNVTNGVTPRRFVRLANPALSALITDALGSGWVTDLGRLRELESHAEDPEFRAAFAEVKAANKRRLSDVLRERDGFEVSDGHMLDVMVKRLHEYKRQMLKVLHVVTQYESIVSGRVAASDIQPRTAIFGAKAAPGYAMAKHIIHLINAVGSVVNDDPRVEGRLKVLFPPNYNVTLAERVIPAADLSEQISLAGTEASGTGNMKFALNGALTIGTDDGANVEIRELVGDENFFLFGMSEPEVEALWARGYKPAEFYQADDNLRRALDLIASGAFSGGNRSTFEPIVSNLLYDDRFMVLADYSSYIAEQAKVDAAYADTEAWTRSAILNVARSGFFSSDRSMHDYIDRIWHTPPSF
jgi:starch phosphorylase